MASRVHLSRRDMLLALAATSAACDSHQPQRGFLGAMERWNEGFQRALFDPERLAPVPGAAEQTPPGAYPAYHIEPGIPLAPAGWSLKVGGMVAQATTLSLAELQRMERTEVRARHHCVEGWTAVATWQGVRLRDLAQRAGADPAARYVEFRSFDAGYWSSWDRESALHPQTILAYAKDGEPLVPAYGAPLRLYAAVKLGYKMVKYLTEVNFLPERTGGYWEDRGYEWFAGV